MKTILSIRSMRMCVLLCAVHFGGQAHAQANILGHWTTIDDNTGQPRSVVEITVHDGVASGHIVSVLDKGRQDALCDKCTDDRKNKPVQGLEIIRGMKRDGEEWSGGTILDPENGKVYDCKLWVEDGELKVRGYIAFFFRTQSWQRDQANRSKF